MIVTGCGTQATGQASGAPTVTAVDISAIHELMLARADAMGKGDRQAFLATIDPARAALRRTQLQEFADPNERAYLKRSTFKVTGAKTYLGYMQAFVEEALEGNNYTGAFSGAPASVRRYFRKDAGQWLLSEPTGDELGTELNRKVGSVDLTYWAADEDLTNLYITEGQAAHDLAVRSAPSPIEFTYTIKVFPTAAAAGPGWFATTGADRNSSGDTRFFPGWWALSSTRAELSPYTRFLVSAMALDAMKLRVLPGLSGRLGNHQWLDQGFGLTHTGIDLSATVRQSCAGVPPPTLRQLNDGPPPDGTPGVSAEVTGRFYAFAWSFGGYLLETYKKDGYWRLLTAINESGATPATFMRTVGATEEDLFAKWLTWLPKKYC